MELWPSNRKLGRTITRNSRS